VRRSYDEPVETAEINALGPARLLEAVRIGLPEVRYYQASTSEMFGTTENGSIAASERHAFHPRSPYGVSKLFAHHLTVNYREAFGLYAVSGILFNHESPMRGRDYVTRKITVGFAEIRHGRRDRISLGNVDARRDWGYAAEYVEGMWRMLQQPTPSDFVLSTGLSNSIATFAEIAAAAIGFRLEWEGAGSGRRGIDAITGKTLITVDESLYRPADIETLTGDAGKARRELGWSAETALDDIVLMMAEADQRRVCDGTLSF
jgi:GDPmannose 4,6-dehydratase